VEEDTATFASVPAEAFSITNQALTVASEENAGHATLSAALPACSVAFKPRVADGMGSQAYKRSSWLFDAATLGCNYVHAPFNSKRPSNRKGQSRGTSDEMQHGLKAQAAEDFFHMGGSCRGFPCSKNAAKQLEPLPPSCRGAACRTCDLREFHKKHEGKLAGFGGDAWFLRAGRSKEMARLHCAGEVPPLRHTTALFHYPRYLAVRAELRARMATARTAPSADFLPWFHAKAEDAAGQAEGRPVVADARPVKSPRPLQVCVHVRRGDVGAGHPSGRHLGVAAWLQVVQSLTDAIAEV
jgi:hypothetical protein